jgi:hypothetical protein
MSSIIFVIAVLFSARNRASSFPLRAAPAANAEAATVKAISAPAASDERLIACKFNGIIPVSCTRRLDPWVSTLLVMKWRLEGTISRRAH